MQPTASGLSGGWIFVIIFCVCTFVYFVGGYAYKMKTEGATGTEAIPHYEFWADIPALVLEGCTYTKDWINEKLGFGKIGYQAT